MAGFRIKVTNKYSGLKAKASFKQYFVDQLEAKHNNAVREWLKEVLKHIPTYTGTARGTYKPLGRMVNMSVKKFGPKGAKGNLDKAKEKIAKSGGTRGFEAGAQYGNYKLTRRVHKSIVFRFEATNDLAYLLWNDMYPAYCGYKKKKLLPSRPPWRAIAAANEAYAGYIRIEMPKVFRKTFKDQLQIIKG